MYHDLRETFVLFGRYELVFNLLLAFHARWGKRDQVENRFLHEYLNFEALLLVWTEEYQMIASILHTAVFLQKSSTVIELP